MHYAWGKPLFGIMVSASQAEPPFGQNNLFTQLCRLGAKSGFIVYVFSPENVMAENSTVQGYTCYAGEWVLQQFPLPDLIYDRSFFQQLRYYHAHKTAEQILRTLKNIIYLGGSLKGKWEIYKALKNDEFIKLHLPFTTRVNHLNPLIHQIKQSQTILLKPEFSTHGKGIITVTRAINSHYLVHGRDRLNQIITHIFHSQADMLAWISSFIGKKSYLAQQFLSLQNKQGCAYDIRVLMQKGGQGNWGLTGMAVRLGQPDSITSNLHGGGQGIAVKPFLEQQFGNKCAAAIILQINRLAASVPPILEQRFGRLVELGIDIGVDEHGAVWLIEVNSKPGRVISQWFMDPTAKKYALGNPFYYARYLWHQSDIGKILGG